MWYELWDSETGNRIGTYPTETEALEAVYEDVCVYGADSDAILSLGLVGCDPGGRRDGLIAEGMALVDLVLQHVKPDAVSTAPMKQGSGSY